MSDFPFTCFAMRPVEPEDEPHVSDYAELTQCEEPTDRRAVRFHIKPVPFGESWTTTSREEWHSVWQMIERAYAAGEWQAKANIRYALGINERAAR